MSDLKREHMFDNTEVLLFDILMELRNILKLVEKQDTKLDNEQVSNAMVEKLLEEVSVITDTIAEEEEKEITYTGKCKYCGVTHKTQDKYQECADKAANK